jgi:vacuolar-type H+-ATPase subunit F/Vma7
MQPLAFIGDEVTATGFRLAGARVYVPEPAPDAVREALEAARAEAAVVLVTAALAGELPPPLLEEALGATAPLTLVVDDLLGEAAPPDLESAMRRALGVETP